MLLGGHSGGTAPIREPASNRIRVGMLGFPLSNLFFLGFDEYSEAVSYLVLEPLVRLSLTNLEPEPALAQSFAKNALHTEFDFELDPHAHFSDGTPVTAEDVLFTWDSIHKPENRTQAFASLFSSIRSCQVISAHKVRFFADKPVADGFALFESFLILPKRHFSNKVFHRDFNESYIGSGPYIFDKVEWGKSISLKANPNYWARKRADKQSRFLIQRVEFQIQTEPALLNEMLLKDEIDYLYYLSAKSWAKDTIGPLFSEHQINKMEVKNQNPFAVAGIAWNMRKPLFSDPKVRKALGLLFDRQRLIKDLFYDQYQLSAGIAPIRSEYHHPDNNPLHYDPQAAVQLLFQAGWKKNSHGVLEKGDTPFTFEILTGNPPAAKHLAIYQEDLKKVGIQASIRIVDWSSYLRLRSQGNFDALDFSRNRNFQMNDLETTWHSSGSKDPSGNITGFSDPAVDSLLEQLRRPLPQKKKSEVIRRLDKLISEAYPIAFSWEPTSTRIAYWNRYSFKKPGYLPFSRWINVFHFWKWAPKDMPSSPLLPGGNGKS